MTALNLSDFNPRSPIRQNQDALKSVFALLCAMGKFYARDSHLLKSDTPHMTLLNRIASALEIELGFLQLDSRYAADLVPTEEEPVIAVRTRETAEMLLGITVSTGMHHRKFHLPAWGSSLLTLKITLRRSWYLADWSTADQTLQREMKYYFPRWSLNAPRLGSNRKIALH